MHSNQIASGWLVGKLVAGLLILVGVPDLAGLITRSTYP